MQRPGQLFLKEQLLQIQYKINATDIQGSMSKNLPTPYTDDRFRAIAPIH